MAERVIRLFGEPEVWVGGDQVRLGVALPLLAVLVLWRRRDDIPAWEAADLLHADWQRTAGRGDEDSIEQRAGWNLLAQKKSLRGKLKLPPSGRQTLTELARSVCGLADVDVARFDDLTDSDDPERLREAVALRGRGPLLAGWEPSHFPIVAEERRAREKKYQRALARLIDVERRDRPWEALRLLDLLLTAEGVSDKRAAELQDLRAALEHEAALRPAIPPPAHNLPARVSTFVGRERELATVKGLLAEHRLVTLTGAGGCGKSRLALQVATELLGSGRDNVWLVELASVTDPGLVPWAVAQPFGLPEQKSRSFTDLLAEYLKPQRLLLVLDNCEHLTDACARLVDRLLVACPGLSVLATSRESLNIDGEKLCRVPSLPSPDPEHLPLDAPDPARALAAFDAARLLVDRANLHMEFALDLDSLAPVAVICKRLDGIPLALELAAARIGELSVAEVAAQLDDRFRLLTRGRRTAPARHATLRAAMDWSYDLLGTEERDLLCRLSVFAGGWTREAAEAVAPDGWAAGEVGRLLALLTRRSLISAAPEDAPPRYGMLETVREYAQDRLRERGERDDTCRRHQDFYLHLAEAAQPRLFGGEQKEWLQRLELEHNNLRTALAWCLQHAEGAEAGLRLCGALVRFWEVRGYLEEGRRRCAAALSARQDAPSTETEAKVFSGVGILSLHLGDLGLARQNFERALAIRRRLGDLRTLAVSLNNLGVVSRAEGGLASAQSHYEEALSLFQKLDDQGQIANTLNNLGAVAFDRGDLRAAHGFLEKGLIARLRIGDMGNVAASLNNLGGVARERGDLAVARSYYEQGLAISRDLGDQYMIAALLTNLGIVARNERDFAVAHSCYEEALEIRREIGDQAGVARTLCSEAVITYDQGDLAAARLLFEQALALSRQVGEWDVTAGTLNNLGKLARKEGALEMAAAYHAESMKIYQDIGGQAKGIYCLEGFAALASAVAFTLRGDVARVPLLRRAARLWGAADIQRERFGAALEHAERAENEHLAAETREALGVGDFEAAWNEGQAMTWEQAAAFALEEAEPSAPVWGNGVSVSAKPHN